MQSMNDLKALVLAGETNWKQYGEVASQEADGLILFNYTPLAQINGTWNWFESVSRGLILSRATGEVVARPFDKFFNWGENGRFPTPGATLVGVQEKMDGSLGIGYVLNGEHYIATRGSRFSPQAQWATEWLRANEGPFSADWTLLYEIIYPENRIVVDYEGWSGLVLLAARSIHTGEYASEAVLDEWAALHYLHRPHSFSFDSPDAIIAAAAELKGAEGWVAKFSDGSRWKFKGDEYRMLHRIISGLSFQSVLEVVKQGPEAVETLRATLGALGGPYLAWADAWMKEIADTVTNIHLRVDRALALMPDYTTRKEFAELVMKEDPALRSYLFMAYDCKSLRPSVLKTEFKDRRDRMLTGGEG